MVQVTRGSQNRNGAVAKQRLRRPRGRRNSPEAVPRPRVGQKIRPRRMALTVKGKRQPERHHFRIHNRVAHVGELLDPDTTLPAAGAFESGATCVGSETLSTAMEICRENNGAASIQMKRADPRRL
jgi:hypothetical protein